MDKNGIPIAYDLFPGNESEKVHIRPLITRVKDRFEGCRIIYVADRGLNTSDNIYWINGSNTGDSNSRDGYVYGQSVRGADAEFKSWILSHGYHVDKVSSNDGSLIIFLHKSRIHPKTLQVNVTKPGQHAFSTGQILDALRNYNCTHLDTNTWKFTYYDEVIDACAKAFGVHLNDKYKTRQEIQRLLRY